MKLRFVVFDNRSLKLYESDLPVCSWLLIRTTWWPHLAAMYSTNVVFPALVGPSSRTGQFPQARERDRRLKLDATDAVSINLRLPTEEDSDQSTISFGPDFIQKGLTNV